MKDRQNILQLTISWNASANW